MFLNNIASLTNVLHPSKELIPAIQVSSAVVFAIRRSITNFQ